MLKVTEVAEFRSYPKIALVNRKATIQEACQKMSQAHVDVALIAEQDKLVGIFSLEDLLDRVAKEGVDVTKTFVEKVMTPHPKTLPPTELYTHAITRMVHGGFHHLPVVDQHQRVLGMIALKDFLQVNLGGMVEQAVKHGKNIFLKSPSIYIFAFLAILYAVLLYRALI